MISFGNCFDQLRCVLQRFLSPKFDEDDHEDIVENTADLTDVDVSR